MITLYTTHCPKCKVLENKLNKKNIEYNVCEDIEIIQNKNIISFPALEIDNKILSFRDAVNWVNEQE
jgi:glutaredoxin